MSTQQAQGGAARAGPPPESIVSAPSSAGLSIRDLQKRYVARDASVSALEAVNLDVRPGELVVIVGASGCGKSTLLRIIAGLEREYEGVVELGGARILGPGRNRGMVFQEHRLFPWLTVRENVEFALEGGSAAERARVVQEHVELVGLAGFEGAYPSQLSGGMAQRAAIARALVNRPEVLLLDEPFGALDALNRIQMQQEILRIWEVEKTTMILVTHDIDEALFLGDRVLVMSKRPGTIQKTLRVTQPRPRNRASPEFLEHRRAIYTEFFGEMHEQWAYAI